MNGAELALLACESSAFFVRYRNSSLGDQIKA